MKGAGNFRSQSWTYYQGLGLLLRFVTGKALHTDLHKLLGFVAKFRPASDSFEFEPCGFGTVIVGRRGSELPERPPW